MKTLAQFKQEFGISKIDLLQGKGRMFASVGNINLVVSNTTDLNEPLFVTPITEDKEGNPVSNAFALINSIVKVVATI